MVRIGFENGQAYAAKSSAEQIAQGDQHILINDWMGMLAAQYVSKLLNREPIHTFISYISMARMAVHGEAIRLEAILPYLKGTDC